MTEEPLGTKSPTEAELRQAWPSLLNTERDTFRECVRLDHASNGEKTPQKAQAVRAYWHSVDHVMSAFLQSSRGGESPLRPQPVEMLMRVHGIARDLSEGIVPTFIADAATPGRPTPHGEKGAIADALFYLEAVRDGRIENKAPTKTVAHKYGVSKTTVHNWRKRQHLLCRHYAPRKKWSAELVERRMNQSAEVYNKFGRGASAEG
jgi:hypothetical protein